MLFLSGKWDLKLNVFSTGMMWRSEVVTAMNDTKMTLMFLARCFPITWFVKMATIDIRLKKVNKVYREGVSFGYFNLNHARSKLCCKTASSGAHKIGLWPERMGARPRKSDGGVASVCICTTPCRFQSLTPKYKTAKKSEKKKGGVGGIQSNVY